MAFPPRDRSETVTLLKPPVLPLLLLQRLLLLLPYPQWGKAEAENEDPSAENSELKRFSL